MIKFENFRDKQSNLIVEELKIEKPLPNQVDADSIVALDIFGDIAIGAVGSSFSFTFILNLAMGTSMSQMLGSIKALQIMIHLCLMNVDVPSIAQSVIGKISQMVVFDPIPMEDQIDQLFSLDHNEENELNSNF